VTAARVWTVLAHPWHECYLDALPFLSEPGDVVRTVAPADYEPATGRTEIVLGVARCPETWGKIRQAPHVLPYETENMLADGPHRAQSLEARAALRRPWLNYSRANARALGDIPLPPRLWYDVEATNRTRTTPKEYDVFFAGSCNARRIRILNELQKAGLTLSLCSSNLALARFGAELAAEEAKARIVLNLHYYEPGVFEVFRVCPALSRGAKVISESDDFGEADEWCDASHPYEKLVDVVLFALGRRRAAAQ
jgi:hypothetical protein